MKRALAAVADSFTLRTTFALGIWVSLYVYAGRPILQATSGSWAPFAAWSVILGASLVSLTPMLAWVAPRAGARLAPVGFLTMSLFSALFVVVAVGDLARAGLHAISWAAAVAAAPPSWTFPGSAAVGRAMLAAAGALTLVGLLQARLPRTRRVSVQLDHLPPELDGFRIVQLSDLHVGPTIRSGFVRCLVDRVHALEPDLVAITGDLVDGSVEQLRDEIAPLGELRAAEGVYWVTGNHEYSWDAAAWIRELQSLGLVFIGNEHRVIRRGGARLVVAGVTDPAGRAAHAPDLGRALEGIPAGAVTLLLAHRPQVAAEASRRGVDLQLSGHTHGGQFFPFNLVIRWFQPVVAGLHRVGRTRLYVSRGTGYWGPPSRLGVGGEITVIELRR